MRILICKRPGGAFGYISDGWLNALRERGHIVSRWDGYEHTWHDFGPDLYIGCSGHKQPIPPRRKCRIAIHVNAHGPVEIPGISESVDDIRWVLNQKPDVVFGYGHEEDRIFWSHWTQRYGIPWVPMPTAGDRTIYKKIADDDQREYDVVYLGGYWAYKGQVLDTYLIPLLQSGMVTYKVHGWGDWPHGICDGILADDKVCKFLNSGRVGPCIAEPHTHLRGIDIPERAWKVALCGALVVHDQTISIRRMMPSAIVASDPDQFRDYCVYFSRPENAAERRELADRQRAEVLSANTYHHRLAGLLEALGFTAEARHMLSQ